MPPSQDSLRSPRPGLRNVFAAGVVTLAALASASPVAAAEAPRGQKIEVTTPGDFLPTPENISRHLQKNAAFVTGMEVTGGLLIDEAGVTWGASLTIPPDLLDPQNEYDLDELRYVMLEEPPMVLDKDSKQRGRIDTLLVGPGGNAIGIFRRPDGSPPTPDDLVRAYNTFDDSFMKKREIDALKPDDYIHIAAIGRAQPTFTEDGQPIPPANPFMGEIIPTKYLAPEIREVNGVKQKLLWAAVPPGEGQVDLLGAPGLARIHKAFVNHKPKTKASYVGNVVEVETFSSIPEKGIVDPKIQEFAERLHINPAKLDGITQLVAYPADEIRHDTVSPTDKNRLLPRTQAELEAKPGFMGNFGPEVIKQQARNNFFGQQGGQMVVLGAGVPLSFGAGDETGPAPDPGDGSGDEFESGSLRAMAGGGGDEGDPGDFGMAVSDGFSIWEDKKHGGVVIGYFDLAESDALRLEYHSKQELRKVPLTVYATSTSVFGPGGVFADGPITVPEYEFCFSDGKISFGGLAFTREQPQRYILVPKPDAKPGEFPYMFIEDKEPPSRFDENLPPSNG